MTHPHIKSIENMEASSLIGILEESKMIYVRENLSTYLHNSQIRLLKKVRSHEKPQHKKIRIAQYKKAQKDDLFKIHLEIFYKKYIKLEQRGLIEIDKAPENGLFYDCTLTEKGLNVLDEIEVLEKEWEEVVGITEADREILKEIALEAFKISYNHKKKQEFIF